MATIKSSILEGLIRDYIVYLRSERRLSPATVSSYLFPVVHFYNMNDVDIKWKRLNKFKAKHYSVVEDKPYTREQIKILVDSATLRDKCIILLMASAGLRRGAFQYLRIRDIEKIDKYQLYKISVYKKEQEQYTTFCTPECAKYIDQYLEWRQRLGERLKPTSPLFRIEFDAIGKISVPKTVSDYVVTRMIHTLLDSSGVREPNETYKRTELMQTHGFRKFFKTTCINAGMNLLYSEYLMGHRSGLTKSYFKPSDTELLEGNDKALGYVAVINDLTINDEYRLHKKIDELTKKKDEIELREIKHREELKSIREEMNQQFTQIISMMQQYPQLANIKPEVLSTKRVIEYSNK
ncbi:MAG TPA: site-specific integrase [Nitrososphaeraceae archaeon]